MEWLSAAVDLILHLDRHLMVWIAAYGAWIYVILFAIVFAVVSITTFALGTYVEGLWFLFWIGLGVAFYGIFYFVFHDVIVHRRIKIKFIAKHPYMKRIMKAHYVHHKVHSREGAEAFGFLYAPKKYD